MSKQAKLEKRNSLISKLTELVTRGVKTAEDKAEFKKLNDAIEIVESDLELLNKIDAKLQANITEARDTRDAQNAAHALIASITPEERKSRQNEALRKYMLTGATSRDLLTSNAGAIIPQELYGNLFERLAHYAPLVGLVTTAQEVNGRPTQFVSVDDTSNFLAVATQATTPAEKDFSASSVVLEHDNLVAKTVVSYQMLNDSAFSIDSILNASAVRMVGRVVETAVLSGVDPANGTLSNQANVLANVTVGTTTTALAGGIGWTDIVNLIGSIDSDYLPNASFVFSYPTFLYLLGQKDGMGRRYYDELYTSRTLAGFPVVLTSSSTHAMPQNVTTANSLPIIFGDWKSAVGLSLSELSIKKLYETHADTMETLFVMYARVASKILVPQAISALKLAAS